MPIYLPLLRDGTDAVNLGLLRVKLAARAKSFVRLGALTHYSALIDIKTSEPRIGTHSGSFRSPDTRMLPDHWNLTEDLTADARLGRLSIR